MRLPGILCSYAGGLLAAPYLWLPEHLSILIPSAAILWALSHTEKLATCSLILLFFCVGLLQYDICITPPDNPKHIIQLADNEPVILEGVIVSINARYPQGASCLIDIESSIRDSQKIAQTGRLQLKIDRLDSPLLPGERIRFKVRLSLPRAFGTPGEFNYPRHLAGRGIFTTAFIKQSSQIARIHSDTPLSADVMLQRWRQKVAVIIDSSTPSHLAPFLRGLATGDRGALSPDQRRLLSQSGLAHLFAISGLHLGIIASFMYVLLLSACRRFEQLTITIPPRRYLPLLVLPIVAGYMVFTGHAISTLRALLVLSSVTIAFLLRRQVTPLQLLSTAALIMLLFDPLAIFAPAFQLSFAGAAGILSITPRWTAFCDGRPRALVYPATLFVITAAATVATLPLILMHFHTLAPAGLLLNLFAVPTITLLAVPLSLGGIVTSAFSPDLAAILFSMAAAVLDQLLGLASMTLDIPGLSGRYLYLSLPALIGLALFSATSLIPASSRLRLAGLTLALTFCAPQFSSHQQQGRLQLIALSVGQGDATLVTDTSGRSTLIDGGGFSHGSYDTGERLVAPALGQLGINEIDTVILTHNHPDHRNGLLHILRNYPVRNFWSPAPVDKLPQALKSILEERNIPVRTFPERWTVIDQDALTIRAVYRVPGRGLSQNDQSLVLYLRNGDEGVLLTGDLERTGIDQLALDPPPGPVTLLKLPHHGSRHSNPQKLIRLPGSLRAYVSVGHKNRYGQPHPEVTSMIASEMIPLERTDESGSIKFETEGNGWKVKRWEKGLFR